MVGVDGGLAHFCPRHRLLAPEPGDPGVEACEGAAERLHLPDAAAFLAVLDALVEEVDAALAHQSFDGLTLWEEHLDRDAVALADGVHDGVGLGVEAPGVQRDDPSATVDAREHVDENDALGTEARDQRDAGRERVDGPREHVPGAALFHGLEV